jgi:hypothetical protein
MAGSRCRVSFVDSDGVLHGVDVDAESLYEAVAVAVASLREDDVSPSQPGLMTEFTVAVYKPPVEHKIRLNQVMKWAEPTTKLRRVRPESPSVSAFDGFSTGRSSTSGSRLRLR